MIITKKVEEAINSQINREFWSSYLYLSMAAYFEHQNLKGFGNWMRVQVQEELSHAMKLYEYLQQRGGKVLMSALEEPQRDWDSPLAAFEHVYEHEQLVTSLINALMDVAIAEKDHATQNMLQWFIAEQVEEEDSASEMVEKIKLMKDAPGGMFMLDQELSQRVFTPSVEKK